MLHDIKKEILKEYSTYMKYWQFSIILFIIMVITALNKCSFLLKSIFFILKEIFVFSFFFLMILLSSLNNTKKILSSSTCVSTNVKIYNIITILIVAGFAITVFLLSVSSSENSSILGFNIGLDTRVFISAAGTVALLATFMYGHICTQLPKLYQSLEKTASKNNYVLSPSQNTTIIGWGILLLVVLAWLGVSDIFMESPDISRYTIKFLVCFGLIFIYFYYLISYNLSYLQKNYYECVNQELKKD